MTIEGLQDVSCIVVHHRKLRAVLAALEALLAGGLEAEAVLVVDNSEDPHLAGVLRDSVPREVKIHTIPNRGYGHAVNCGIAHMLASRRLRPYTLVASHEVQPQSDALSHLRQTLVDDGKVGVAGPSLIDGATRGERFWSLGGELTRLLNHPRHVGWGRTVRAELPSDPQARDWLDGAFCLYRSSLFASMRLREDFFLYFEENDFHARIRRAGYRVVWVPQAFVLQSSAGTPPYLLGRNLQLFQAAHGTRLQRRISVPAMIARRGARRVLRGGPPGELWAMARGWRDGLHDLPARRVR